MAWIRKWICKFISDWKLTKNVANLRQHCRSLTEPHCCCLQSHWSVQTMWQTQMELVTCTSLQLVPIAITMVSSEAGPGFDSMEQQALKSLIILFLFRGAALIAPVGSVVLILTAQVQLHQLQFVLSMVEITASIAVPSKLLIVVSSMYFIYGMHQPVIYATARCESLVSFLLHCNTQCFIAYLETQAAIRIY